MPTEATWYEEIKAIVYKFVAGEVQFRSHQTISLKDLFRSLNITYGNRFCFVTELSFLSSWKFWRYCLIRRRSWNTNYSSIPVSRSLYLLFVSLLFGQCSMILFFQTVWSSTSINTGNWFLVHGNLFTSLNYRWSLWKSYIRKSLYTRSFGFKASV